MQGSKGDIEKREVEELLHATIGDELFRDALEMAKRKQAYIYSKDRRPAVLQRWYLVKHFIFPFHYGHLQKDEQYGKENRTKGHGSPTCNHIVTIPTV